MVDAGPPDAGDAGPRTYHRVKWHPLRPNLMLAVDKSGSMVEPVDRVCNNSTDPTCCTSGGFYGAAYDPNSPNDCKWKDLLTVLTDPNSGILPAYQASIRFGLAMFPGDLMGFNQCVVGQVYEEPTEYNAGPVDDVLLTATPQGGTPTANTLAVVGKDSALQDPLRTSYVLLVTDGAPNCNGANAAKCDTCNSNPASCYCSVNPDGTSPCCNPDTGGSCSVPSDGDGCLDGDGTIAAIKALKAQGITTIVLGLGSETTAPNAYAVLNAAAVAGGVPLAGTPSFYQASTAAQLASFMDQIAKSVPQCKFQIEEDVPQGQLLASIDGTSIPEDPQNGFTYDETLHVVTFNGTSCKTLSDGQQHTVVFEAP